MWVSVLTSWRDNHDNCWAKKHPDSVVIIFVDLNRAHLSRKQSTTTTTTKNCTTATLPKDVYQFVPCAGSVRLFPAYRENYSTTKIFTRKSKNRLMACFVCTNWSAFEHTTSLSEFTNTSYYFWGHYTFSPSLREWNWKPTFTKIVKKAKQRLYFLQQLR